MRIIKRLITDMSGNIDEARDKIRTAYELKAEAPEAAEWYREMACAHINFNSEGHAAVRKLIEKYKASEEYRRNQSFADGMISAWEAVHKDLITRTAEVKALCDGYN